jgi:hypothetical protein
MVQVNKRLRYLVLLIIAIGMAFTSSASANPGIPIPGTMTATSQSFETGLASKDITVKTWVGVQEHIRVQKHVSRGECHWYKEFWNSNYKAGETSKVPYMYKDYNGYLCKDKYSSTGLAKYGGGHTKAECLNIAAPITEKPKYKVLPMPSIELKHNTSLTISVNVTVSAEAFVELWCGRAHGNGSITETVQVDYLTYIKAKSADAKLKLFLQVAIKASDKAEAEAKLTCSYTPPPEESHKPPPNCHENHTCSCQEEGTCLTPSITITSMTTLNMIPEGKNSGPFDVFVNASEAGGSLTVDPGIGAVSGCESNTPESSVTFEHIPAGNSKACIILYAPSDSDKPSSMTVTFTAILGSAKDVKTQTFEIQYPTRPS